LQKAVCSFVAQWKRYEACRKKGLNYRESSATPMSEKVKAEANSKAFHPVFGLEAKRKRKKKTLTSFGWARSKKKQKKKHCFHYPVSTSLIFFFFFC